MGLTHISILQVGDVHFPDLVLAPPLADIKDKGFSSAAIEAIVPTRIAEITKGLDKLCRTEAGLLGVALTGDLTTQGSLKHYSECLEYLKGVFRLEDSAYWSDRKLFVVPGNHDIDRHSIVLGEDLTKKFLGLSEAWERLLPGKNPLSVGTPTPTDLRLPGSTVCTYGIGSPTIRVLPLNTCYFCGEHRSFPDAIRAELLSIFSGLKSKLPAKEFHDLMSEQIDCPAIVREHLEHISTHIRSIDASSVSVLIGHHPLFPQPTPRISGFTEVINAGFARETLLQSGRDLIYLHGHIHQDPLLVVNNPGLGRNRIIHISAPALQDGFNLIRVFYSNKTACPLGIEVVPYRFGDQLGLVANPSFRLRTINDKALWNEVDDVYSEFLLGQLGSPAKYMRFSEFTKNAPPRITKKGTNLDDLFEQSLRSLEILELIEITNRESHRMHWQLRRRSV